MSAAERGRRATVEVMDGINAAAATRIADALLALEREIAAAGIPVDAREDLIVLLAARRREERLRRDRVGWRRLLSSQDIADITGSAGAGGVAR
jgi:hypothetical protein